MKIDFEGRTWQVDIDDLSMNQSLAITAHMGATLTGWQKALEDVESPGWLPAMQCLHWLMLAQNGETARIGETDFAVLRFSQAFAAAIEAEELAAKAAADPTKRPATPAPAPGAAASAAGTPGTG